MSMLDVPIRPATRRRPAPPAERWQVGDIVSFRSTGMRFKIRMILDDGTVELESMNSVNAESWWATSLDQLPLKQVAR